MDVGDWLTLLGYTEGSREKSPRAARGYKMTWRIPLAVTLQEDETSRSTQHRQEKGVAWLLVDIGFRLEGTQELRNIARAV